MLDWRAIGALLQSWVNINWHNPFGVQSDNLDKLKVCLFSDPANPFLDTVGEENFSSPLLGSFGWSNN